MESRSHPKFLPRLALKCIWIRILTYQFPFPGLMIPEDFSWLGCGEEFVFIYSRALRIIPEIISLLESMGIALRWASCCGEQSADTLQVSWGGGNSSDPHVPPEHGLFQLCLAMSLSLQKHYSSFEAFRNSAAHCIILLMRFFFFCEWVPAPGKKECLGDLGEDLCCLCTLITYEFLSYVL